VEIVSGEEPLVEITFTLPTPTPTPTPTPKVTPPPPPPAAHDTTLGSKPKKTVKTKTKRAKVRFGFSSPTAGATFQCKIDKGAFAPCTSPKKYNLKTGKHTTYSFKVKKTK
jgi:hypothetical protein